MGVLHDMIRNTDPALFNQAIMNFGAMQCRPRNPDCTVCILGKHCIAYREGIVEELPVRKPKRVRQQRHFHYIIIKNKGRLVIRQRHEADIWRKMYELPMLETRSSAPPSIAIWTRFLGGLGLISTGRPIQTHTGSQTLTHQVISCHFYEVYMGKIHLEQLPPGYRFELFKNLKTLAYPKVIRTFLSGRFSTFNETQKLD
jgi:A/G-specific adenine glycosylase